MFTRLITILLCTLVFCGCAAQGIQRQSQVEGSIAWPPPPAPPRIEFVKEIRNHEDAGIRRGFWQRFSDFVFGDAPANMVKPYGIHLTPNNRLFIVDTERAALHLMDLNAGKYALIDGSNGSGSAPLFQSPVSITGDHSATVYVTDSAAGIIYQLSPPDYRPELFTVTPVQRPTGIVFNPKNNLIYVSDTAAHQVIAFDQHGGERFRIGYRGTNDGTFNFPTDLAVDADGNLFVTDSMNNRIQIFSMHNKLLNHFGEAGNQLGYLNRPKGIALDSDHNIYNCDALQDAVQIFDCSGRLLLSFGESGSGPGQFWMPSGIFIDRDDYIYVSDSYNQRVQVFRYLKQNSTDDPLMTPSASGNNHVPPWSSAQPTMLPPQGGTTP